MTATGEVAARRPREPYWAGLLIVGVVLAGLAVLFFAIYFGQTRTSDSDINGVAITTHPHSGYFLWPGVAFGLASQVLLGAGTVGLGVASARRD